MAAKSDKKKVDPFKTRKTKTETTKVSDSIDPPEDIAAAVDQFRDAQDQAKHFEGEATVHKEKVLNFSLDAFTERLFKGMDKSFKVMGHEGMATFVIMDSSSGLTEEDAEAFAERWGEEAADELIVRDYRSIRFDAKVLEANYDKVVEALQSLPPEVLENLFKPMLMKATPGALESAKKYANTPEDMRELMTMLKMKAYLR